MLLTGASDFAKSGKEVPNQNAEHQGNENPGVSDSCFRSVMSAGLAFSPFELFA